MTDRRFAIGDHVRHLPSGRRGIVVACWTDGLFGSPGSRGCTVRDDVREFRCLESELEPEALAMCERLGDVQGTLLKEGGL